MLLRQLALAALLLLITVPAGAAEGEDAPDNKSRVQLPRFGILRFAAVNLRTGPGTRYPIEWVYRRAGMPVEVTALFDTWYRVRDYEGSEGWVHKTQVKMQRRGIIAIKQQAVRSDPEAKAKITAHLQPNVMFNITSCDGNWCAIKGEDFKGYLPQTAFFGAYPHEKFE